MTKVSPLPQCALEISKDQLLILLILVNIYKTLSGGCVLKSEIIRLSLLHLSCTYVESVNSEIEGPSLMSTGTAK